MDCIVTVRVFIFDLFLHTLGNDDREKKGKAGGCEGGREWDSFAVVLCRWLRCTVSESDGQEAMREWRVERVADGNDGDDAPARSGPRLRAMPFKSNMLCPMPFEEDMPYTLNFPANEVCSHEKVCHIGEYAFSRYMPYMRVDCTYLTGSRPHGRFPGPN
jgi:hypothetical protein